jgi:hypothetical protein
MEEGEGYSKIRIIKILHVEGKAWQVNIGGAGASAILDLVFEKLKHKFLSYGSANELASGHVEAIRSVLYEVHERYIWPSRLRDYSIELLISIHFEQLQQSVFYKTQEYIPHPVEDHACIGVGSVLGNYLASILYSPTLTRTQIIYLGAFIVREIREAVSNCGEGTQMEITMRNGQHYSIGPEVFEMMDMNELPARWHIADWFWDKLPPGEYSDRQLDAWNNGDLLFGERFTEHWKPKKQNDIERSGVEKSEPDT